MRTTNKARFRAVITLNLIGFISGSTLASFWSQWEPKVKELKVKKS